MAKVSTGWKGDDTEVKGSDSHTLSAKGYNLYWPLDNISKLKQNMIRFAFLRVVPMWRKTGLRLEEC